VAASPSAFSANVNLSSAHPLIIRPS